MFSQEVTRNAPYSWWDDAIEVARVRAIFTGRRQRVRAWLGRWIVEEIDAEERS